MSFVIIIQPLQNGLEVVAVDALDEVADMPVHLTRLLNHGPVRAILERLQLEARSKVLPLAGRHPGRQRGVLVRHEQHRRYGKLEVVIGYLRLVVPVELASSIPVTGAVEAVSGILLHVEVDHLLAHQRALSDVVDIFLEETGINGKCRLPLRRRAAQHAIEEITEPLWRFRYDVLKPATRDLQLVSEVRELLD